ncbi:MAG: S41 family peptidase [Bacteroidetes bacterium]|nr:S41 family peptidase [Bacteroidota bacterium]
MNNRTSIWYPFIIAVAIAVGILTGYVIQGRYNDHQPQLISIGKSTKIDEILGYVNQKYVEDIDSETLSDAAIEEILKELDPHSIYIPVDEMKSMQEDMRGNFEGIGIEFFIVDDTIMVVTPLSGGPSEALGILSGDRIVMIGDSLVAGNGITNAKVVKMLKGPKGTKVTVSIKRSSVKELLDFTIQRDKIPIVSVDVGYMVDDEIGYIKINRFSANTYNEFMQEMDELTDAGMSKLVLDLRQNPGGYLEEATKILDEFIDGRKELVYTSGRQHPKFTYNARRPGLFEHGEIIVLIDEGSASASEIVAGSLQDWDRASIIGRRSFGKGLVQEQYALQDGSALRLTVAKYYTPSGRCIQKPYEYGGDSKYDHDINNRYENGELFSEDSIHVVDSLVYLTKVKGRKVYGGGGILPDSFVPFDTIGYDDVFLTLSRRGILQQFAYDYYAGNKEQFTSFGSINDFLTGYDVPAAVLEDFIQFADNQEIEGVSADLDVEVLDNICHRLKASFAKQTWNGDGYYPVLLEDDVVFETAISQFKNISAVK